MNLKKAFRSALGIEDCRTQDNTSSFQVVPFTGLVDIVQERSNQIAMAETVEAKNELTEVSQGLAGVVDVVETLNENGGLSTESAVLARLALESYTKRLGLEDNNDIIPSFESLRYDGSRTVSTEGFVDLIKKVGGAVKTVREKIRARVGLVLGMLRPKLAKTLPKLEALKVKIDGFDGKPADTIPAKGVVKRFHRAGVMPEKLSSFLDEYLAFAAVMFTKWPAISQSAFTANVAAMNQLDLKTQDSFLASLKTLASGWKDPTKTFTAAQLKTIVPGGGELFTNDDPSEDYAGDNTDAKKLAKYASSNLLTGRLLRTGDKVVDKVDVVKALSKAEMQHIVNALLRVVKMIDADRLVVSGEHVNAGFATISGFAKKQRYARTVARNLQPEIYAVEAAFESCWTNTSDFGWMTAQEVLNIANGFIDYAERSMASAK